MIEKIKDQGTLLTSATVVLIISGGILIIDRPDNWGFSLALVVSLVVIVFSFINARTVVKSIVAIITAFVGAAFGAEFSLQLDPTGRLGVTWGLVYLSLFFACIALSYYGVSVYNRWGLATITMALTWVFILIGVSFTLNSWGVAIGALLGLAYFAVFYFIIPRRGLKDMPVNTIEESALNKMKSRLKKNGFAYTEFIEKNGGKYVLVWPLSSPSISYVLYPIKMDQPFGNIGKKKKVQLSYKGKSINYWLQTIVFKISQNSAIGVGPVVVLWDYNGGSKKTKIIGMSSPDYKDPIAVGFMEGKFTGSLSDFDDYAGLLKYKQLERFKKINEAINE